MTTFIPLSQTLKNRIQELLSESIQFNTNDVLVNIEVDNKTLVFNDRQLIFDSGIFPKRILLDAKKNKKESGINSLCETCGIVKQIINGKDVQTPIMIFPLQVSLNKIKGELTFTRNEEDAFINPFLLRHIKENIESNLIENQLDLDEVIKELEILGMTTNATISAIGNFHHHRYFIVKELEEILALDQTSANISQLFGEQIESNFTHQKLTRKKIVASDTDHELVFEKAAMGNSVIQGPPGTGKSQVLTNLIAKYLYANKTSIVVSEKRVALEVIQKKLSNYGLDKFAFIASSNKLSHSFLQELKQTWDYLESAQSTVENNLLLSDQYLDNLQMSLDLLNNDSLIGGISYTQFQELASKHHLIKYNYVSDVLEIDSFLAVKNELKSVYDLHINDSLSYLRSSTISSEKFDCFDEKIEAWKIVLDELSELFVITSWNSFTKIQKDAANCQIFENEIYKKYASIFKLGSRPNKHFLSLRKKYLASIIELDSIAQNQSHWKTIPSETETISLQKSIASSPGFFERRKLKKRWAEIANTPFETALENLEIRSQEITVFNTYSKILIDFCELGIDSPGTDVDLIHLTLNQFSAEQWTDLSEIPEEKRLKITSNHTIIRNLYHDLKAHFDFKSNVNVIEYLELLSKQMGSLLSEKSSLLKLSDTALKGLQENSTFTSYEGQLLQSHFVRFKEQFPAFASFKNEDLKSKILDIETAYFEEQKSFASEIESSIIDTFNSYHELLNTSARKLTEEQKELKATLRKGKSILIKEFAKSKNHPSLRELHQSEAKLWINLLKPIWLSNPSQISNCFPLEEAIFDIAIFDEASQIPIQNALGTIHRASQIIVAGDENQMGPSNYFKSGDQESLDILHQANYNWPNIRLKHHYRSVHPDLISFSNTHFYNNELTAYPQYNALLPIRHHYIEDGRFIDRKNEIEAKAVVQRIREVLKTSGSIGVVAFSEEQLSLIWNLLSANEQEELNNKLDSNEGFFKALENVQGDECDSLIISFGYGKNEEDKFMMRFGPMNSANGRKRLNVLLTRAINTIDFFCSVSSSDFKLTDNESIQLLRKWIAFSESYKNEVQYAFPIDIQPIISASDLNFKSIHTSISNAKELHTFTTVLSSRGWNVNFS